MTSIAFLGSHSLGVTCLQRLADASDVRVEVVITYPPDEETWWEGSVYERADELGYPILTINEEEALLEYEVDYILSVYYPNVLGPELLSHPEKGALNLHQAELPRYRGSNVFSHSIMNAREDDHWKHGTTLHFMAEEIDAGDVIARGFAEITEEDTARTLYDKVEEVSVDLFERMLPHIVSGEIHHMRTPQAEFDGPRYFYSKASLDGEKEIPAGKFGSGGIELYDRIRALDFPPFEPAYTSVGDRRIYLTKTGYDR